MRRARPPSWTARTLRVALVAVGSLVSGLPGSSGPAPAGAASPPRQTGALPPGYLPLAESQPLIDKTLVLRLAPDLSDLAPGERAALDRLLWAGRILQSVYEDSAHRQAKSAYRALVRLDRELGSPPATSNLLVLYRVFQGPIAATLDNRRIPFLPVDPVVPGKAVYPWGITKPEVEAALAARPDDREALLDARSVVRDASSARADLATLDRHPELDVLHPGLRARIQAARKANGAAGSGSRTLYAIPDSLAYADRMREVHALLVEAAGLLRASDPELAAYLRLRARDLLTDDYFAGDVAWVTGRFGKLNVQIGAYETYDDELYGVKAFHGMSVLKRDVARSEAVAAAVRGLQALEESLPYARHKKVREDIPVGVYDVVADFGQPRGTNTATILPNDATTARRFGRTILMRHNILTHPELLEARRVMWAAATAPGHASDLEPEGSFYRTLWHEIGHYLGVDATRDGRDLDQALEEDADLLEEMKADLVALFVAEALAESGYYDAAKLRGVYADGILRTLDKTRPRRDQAYQTMQLMQMNEFLDKGLLRFDPGTRKLAVDYARYHEVVGGLLREVLAIQDAGDKAAADRFIERLTRWEPDLHEAIAKGMRDAEKSRFRLVRYAALGE